MNILWKYWIALFLLVAATSPTSLYASEAGLGLEISLSKQTYILHERIWLDVTLTNNSSDTVRTQDLTWPNQRQFTIELSKDGDLLEHTGWKANIAGGPGRLLLDAGGEEYGSFNLVDLYGLEDTNSGYRVHPWLFRYIPTGQYTVRVHFEEAVSNELTFAVVEPFGLEVRVLKLIEEVSLVYSKENRASCAQQFKDIVDVYPQSVFAQQCFRRSSMDSHEALTEQKQGTFDKRDISKAMLLNYPNSGNSWVWLRRLLKEMDDDRKMEFLNRIIQDKPNTRASRFAKQERDKILQQQRLDKGGQ